MVFATGGGHFHFPTKTGGGSLEEIWHVFFKTYPPFEAGPYAGLPK